LILRLVTRRPIVRATLVAVVTAALAFARPLRAEPPLPSDGRPSGAAAPAPTGLPALTGFESSVAARVDVILVGRARLVTLPAARGSTVTVKGTTVARVQVEKVLKGTAEPEFTLFVLGPRNTDDPRAPSAPYLDATARRVVLFLRSTPNGSGLSLETLFPADDLDGREKLAALERELEVFAIPDAGARRRRTLALLQTFIASEVPWTRTHGIRELETLSRRAPEAFDDVALARLDALRSGIPDRSERAFLAATLDRLDPDRTRRDRGASGAAAAPTEPIPGAGSALGADAAGGGAAPTQSPVESKAYRKAKARLEAAIDDETRTAALSEMARVAREAAAPDLLAAFASGTVATRERAAVLLADLGVASAWPRLREAFAVEREPVVREALLRAAGFLGEPTDVEFVRSAQGAPLLRGRCFALARLRTPAALAALAAEREAARAATPCDEATVALVDYLMGPAFEKTDPAIRLRAARPVEGGGGAAGPASGADAGMGR